MNDQERQVISEIFQRLEQVADQPRDPEAERFIQENIRRQPYASYAMAQALYVQEQALQNLNAQLEAVQAENEELRNRPQQGGFLSNLFGGGGREPERRGSFSQPQGAGGPWGQPGPQPGMGQGGPYGQPGMGQPMGQPGMGQQPGMGGPFGAPQRGGSGFLGTALTTAAGVAGGMMLGSALSNAFGGGSGGHGAMGGGLGGGAQQASAGNSGDFSDLSPFGSSSAASGRSAYQDSGNDDASLQDASFEDDDFGGDAAGDPGGDDWT
jgi:hypothetical protein